MSYEETIEWLYGLDARKGMDFRLERLAPVLAALGNPEKAFPSVHVAGTNGKGSTAAMIHSVYSQAGYRAGLYTSPHLVSFRERVRVGRDLIDPSSVVAHTVAVRAAMDRTQVELTFFEIATLIAFLEFRERGVDVAVVEVGLGGRLDATNVVRSVACVITTVALDHGEYLGHTLAEVAGEKAGIVKPGIPLITGPLEEEASAVIERYVDAAGTRWLRYGVDFGPGAAGAAVAACLPGAHQARNAALAGATVELLAERFPVTPEELATGLAATRWPGRFERLGESPTVVLDAAHNPHAIAALVDALDGCDLGSPRVLVFGVMADKDWREMLCRLVPAFDEVVLVPVAMSRSLDPAAAHELVAGLKPCRRVATAAEGLELARRSAGADGLVVVTGSIFLVGEVYELCRGAGDPIVGGDAR